MRCMRVSMSGESFSPAEDGIRVTNTIVLEPEVIAALEEYLKERSAT